MISDWLLKNWIEIFGAVTGIVYVFLEIRQNSWLWPVGIITSAVYIWVFFSSKFYADMSLQWYYLMISCLGWYWWIKSSGHKIHGRGEEKKNYQVPKGEGDIKYDAGIVEEAEKLRLGEEKTERLRVTRLRLKTGVTLSCVFVIIYIGLWLVLSKLTDSPVPAWDSFITSLSIVATWMLARKIYEHWYLWIIVNSVSIIIFIIKGLYPTVILYVIYCLMSFAGLKEWRRTL